MNKMTEVELLAIIDHAEQDAAIYNGEFMALNEKFLKEYLGELYGDEIEDQSQAVSTDIFDVIESDMPALMRIFCGSGDIITFPPSSNRPEAIKEAKEKTKYINWIVRSQPESFTLLHNWIKDALIQKNSVVKYYIDEEVEIEEVQYTGLNEEEIAALEESLDGEVSKAEVIQNQDDPLLFDVSFRVKRVDAPVRIINVAPENFLISKNATSLEDAELVGDKIRKTRGQLIAEGYKRELIDRLPSIDSDDDRRSNIRSIRNNDQGGADYDVDIRNWASEEVEISDLYVFVDYDNDGIAERRHIMKSGNILLENEPFNHVPYASLSAYLMPHKAIGRSRAEVVSPKQKQKTALLRGMLNNIWMVNNPRNIVHDDVDLDDLLTVRPNGVVRMEADSSVLPGQAVFPLQIPYIGDKTLQVIQYVDASRAQSTGVNQANQGLDADSIAKETATRFEGVQEQGAEKLELIARNFAETGFRKLFEGIAWLAHRYQDAEKEIMVLGKELKVNPSKWKYKTYCVSQVGLGAGNNEKTIASLQGLYQIQQQLKQTGSLLTDDAKIYSTLNRIIDGLGFPDVGEFFNDVNEPDDVLKAQNEQLNQMVLMLQEQITQMQNPLQQAEETRAQAKLIEAQGKQALEAAKMQEGARQFDAKQSAELQKQLQDISLKLTELEMKAGRDLNAEMQDNMLVFDPAIGDFV